MRTSKENEWKMPRQKRLNLRVLTQVRQNFQDSKALSIQFRTTSYRTGPRLRKQPSSHGPLPNPSKKTLGSLKNMLRKDGGWLPTSSNLNSYTHVEIVREEIQVGLGRDRECGTGLEDVWRRLEEIFQIGELINQGFYNYKFVEGQIKVLNERVRDLKSLSLQFYCYTVSALILYQYSSLSLTLFYFDKSLKLLSHISPHSPFDQKLQLLIYKHTCKLFLQVHKIRQAREMGYMYLRKCWRARNVDEEMNAYDLLGIVELEDGNLGISRYLHWRMCHNVREDKDILLMSNHELQKNQRNKPEYSVFEDIMQFVRAQQKIVSLLSNHFRSESEQHPHQPCSPKTIPKFLYTHRSSNRLLRNHRTLERKLIDERESKELHFVRARDLKRLHKLITEFNCFVFDLRRGVQGEINGAGGGGCRSIAKFDAN